MRTGAYENAWAISARILAERDPATRDDPTRPYHRRWVWDGSDVAGRHVLVRCYHGLGDTIQFARFLPALGMRAASVTLEAQPALCGILTALPGVARVIPFDPVRPAPPSECDIEITELQFALRAAPSTGGPPYLQASAAPLPPGTIALCYGTSDWDVARRLPPSLLRPLCERWPCLVLQPEPCGLPVINPTGCSLDITETASLIAGAALVVTVDTMVAHLAGAMGRAVWLLLKTDPDWRWMPHASGSPWYPTMRIFTQPRAGDWQAVLVEVEQAIEHGFGGLAGERGAFMG